MNQLALTSNTTKLMAQMFRAKFDIALGEIAEKYPAVFQSIVKEAIAQEAVKKINLKSIFNKFKEGGILGGLFGRGGVFSFLGKTLFKKPSSDLVAGTPLEKNLDTNLETDTATTTQTPLQPVSKQTSKEKDYIAEEIKPIPILIAGFTPEGRNDFAEVLPPLFEDIFKKIFTGNDFLNALEGIQPEMQENYGGGLLEAAMALPLLGGAFRGLKRVTGFGKGGFFRNRKAARLRANRAATRAAKTGSTPSIKPSTPLKQAGKAATTGETAALKGAAKATSTAGKGAVRGLEEGAVKGATKGLGRGLTRGASRLLPGLGTALTVGFLASDLASVAEQEAKGEITQKEAYKQKGGAWGGAGGTMAGAAAGAAIGAMFGGVGAIPGAIIGGMLGGLGGQMGGEVIGESIAPEESKQPIAPPPASETPNIDIPEPPDYTKTLSDIVANTGKTSDKITRLSDAIFALANTFKNQPSNTGPKFIINNQQNDMPSASQVAASNNDAISHVRQQFAV